MDTQNAVEDFGWDLQLDAIVARRSTTKATRNEHDKQN